MLTIESESGNGRGLSRTAFTTLKMAVFAPMPRVRMASAEIAKPGFLRNTRKAWGSCAKTSLMVNTGYHVQARHQSRMYCGVKSLRNEIRRLVVRVWDGVSAGGRWKGGKEGRTGLFHSQRLHRINAHSTQGGPSGR